MKKVWIKAAAVRAVKTIAQTAVAMIGTSVVIADVNWLAVVSASLLAGILSILTSIAGLPETTYDTSVVGGEMSGNTEEQHEDNDPKDSAEV